jgi:hypothetical protein
MVGIITIDPMDSVVGIVACARLLRGDGYPNKVGYCLDVSMASAIGLILNQASTRNPSLYMRIYASSAFEWRFAVLSER